MHTSTFVAILLLATTLAGCTSNPDPSPPPPDDAPAPTTTPTTSHEITFTVQSQGETTTIAATWFTDNRTTARVALAVHGSVGVRWSNWGPLDTPGYSLARRSVENGTHFVSIDLPGYGDSPETGATERIEDNADVIDQIATQLRQGTHTDAYDQVVGIGHSLGGLAIDIAQGRTNTFDAIAVTGWAHAGFSDEFNDCFLNDVCPEQVDTFFNQSRAEPDVVKQMMDSFEPVHPGGAAGALSWGTRNGGPDAPSSQDAVLAAIDVPVLIVLGQDDWHWDQSLYGREERYYPNAVTFQLQVIPSAGHFQYHHANRAQGHQTWIQWLDTLA